MNLRNPKTGADRLFQASKVASGVLVASLRGGTPLDSVAHRAQVRGAGAAARKEKAVHEKEEVKRMKDKAVRTRRSSRGCSGWVSVESGFL